MPYALYLEFRCKSLSCVRLFATPWIVACQALCPRNSAGKKLFSNQFFFFRGKKKKKPTGQSFQNNQPIAPSCLIFTMRSCAWSTRALDSSSASIPPLNTFTHPEPGVQLTECSVFLTKRRLLNGFFPLSDTHVHYPHLLPTLFI